MAAKTFKATWLGDEDPLQQTVEIGGVRFVKGEPTPVPADHPMAEKIRNNPRFSSEKDPDLIAAQEPPAPDPLEGTELGAARKEAESLGISVPENATLDSIRGKIAAYFGR